MIRARGIAGLLAVAAAWMSWACDVPVFRYALERWEADPYPITLFHRGPLEGEDAAIWTSIDEAAGPGALANLTARAVDLDGALDPALEALWNAQTDAAAPWLVLHYPRGVPRQSQLWAGPLTAANRDALLDSPARREIARRILDGESAVWALLESGDAAADDMAAATLERELAAAESELTLPDRTGGAVPKVDETKLRVAFSYVRVSRNNPSERLFAEMLLGVEPDLRDFDGLPIAFPVYGRGRALYALVGKGINAKMIRESCAFVVGSCSCQVKEDNPGVDMLFAADWDGGIKEFLLDNPTPAALPSPALLQASAPAEAPAAATAPASEPPAPPIRSSSLMGAVIKTVVISVVGIVLASWALSFRKEGGAKP